MRASYEVRLDLQALPDLRAPLGIPDQQDQQDRKATRARRTLNSRTERATEPENSYPGAGCRAGEADWKTDRSDLIVGSSGADCIPGGQCDLKD